MFNVKGVFFVVSRLFWGLASSGNETKKGNPMTGFSLVKALLTKI